MRSIVVRAMPVSRCTSLLLRPASTAARTTSSRRLPTASCSAARAVSICLACRTVSSVTLHMLHFCSTYCNRGASPITGRHAARAGGHGSRNGTGRDAGPQAGRGAGITALRSSGRLRLLPGEHTAGISPGLEALPPSVACDSFRDWPPARYDDIL